jgi:phenylalanyl-tRNA synthetase beta chain
MKVPLSWLREFAPIEGAPDELAGTFSNLGLVVDGFDEIGAELDGVVVARVLALRPHPGADKVQLVDVDAGSGEPMQIVCGAFNMAPGDLVPLATVGSVLPGGRDIGRRKVRGEWSNGMLCSAPELGMPEQASIGKQGESGILVLPAGTAEPGAPLVEALGLAGEVVFDLDITPNRPDALSIAGVARDVAAALNIPFALPVIQMPVDPGVERAAVEVLDPDLCPRFTATVLDGVTVVPSPVWMARRLTLCGMRPINNVVDASNYVMLELGQPNHPYDLDRLPGRGLQVRRATPGETLETLDGVTRQLERDDCLICDATGAPVGIGGIMGGASSEISLTTSTVLLEVAYFTPMAIARTGKRLALQTEARSRFERGCDPSMIDLAVERFASLLPGVRRGATVDVASDEYLPKPTRVRVRTKRVNDILGTSLTDEDVATLVESIGFGASPVPGEPSVQEVTIPTRRPDTEREIDVIEEVARLHGYRNIERTLPPGVRTGGGLTPYQKMRRRVRDFLAGAGVSEGWTTTFLAPGDLERAGLPAEAVEVANPLDRSESLLRTALLPGLLKAVRFNVDRQEPDVRLFEIGRVFDLPAPPDVVPQEREDLAVIVAGDRSPGDRADGLLATRLWRVLADGLRLTGVSLIADSVPGFHPTRTARIVVDSTGASIGAVGEVDPSVVAAYGLSGRIGFLSVSLEALAAAPRRSDQAMPVSRFPASDFDLAFVVPDEVPAAAVEHTLRSAAGDLLERIQLFDIYRGPQLGTARRSLAYRLRLRALDRTLTDSEVATVRQQAIDAVVVRHGAQLRGV